MILLSGLVAEYGLPARGPVSCYLHVVAQRHQISIPPPQASRVKSAHLEVFRSEELVNDSQIGIQTTSSH